MCRPVIEVSQWEEVERMLHLSLPIFSPPSVPPVLMSQRFALQPACMWGGFCHFLSITTHHTVTRIQTRTHTPPRACWHRYITAQGFLGWGRFILRVSLISSLSAWCCSCSHPRKTWKHTHAFTSPAMCSTSFFRHKDDKDCCVIH